MKNDKKHGSRLSVTKTYKMYVDGKYPRSESGRYYSLTNKNAPYINVCLGSRKDLRDAITAAKTAQLKWSQATAYNRSQILYRIGEMLETRREQFVQELMWQGYKESEAQAEVSSSVDRLVYYAGWADKYQQVFSSVNPVASNHFNFSTLEATGVVGIFAPAKSGLLGLVSLIAPVIVGGNSCVVLASEMLPLCAVTFGEVLGTSDVPAGVVNILTGKRAELLKQFATHMELNAIVAGDLAGDEKLVLEQEAMHNVKRIRCYEQAYWESQQAQGPHFILDVQEVKTAWHPMSF